LAAALKKLKLKFEMERMVNLEFDGQKIAKKFIATKFGYVRINQVLSYLKTIGAKLAIIIYFLRDGRDTAAW
jgi:hypothetical protein